MKQVLKKLAKMSAGEIQFRVQKKIAHEAAYYRDRLLGIPKPLALDQLFRLPSGVDPLRFLVNESAVNFFSLSGHSADLGKNYQSLFPESHAQALADADKLLTNKFHLLGIDFDLGQSINWTHDPVTGLPYDNRFYTRVEIFKSEKVGADIKYVWELNRHQFCIEVAKAYFISGDEKYAQKLVEWVTGWAEQNPYKHGVNWTSALESAVRIYAWTWAFYFTRESKIWDKGFTTLFFNQLWLNGTFTEDNLSFYFSPYNHLIGEIAALSFLGTVFPELQNGNKWRDKYWKLMESEIPKQFYRDGLIVEQATYYHHFTTGFYLQNALLRQQNKLPVSATTLKTIENALNIAMHMTKPDGTLPMIGDIDSARILYFYMPRRQWDLRGFQAAGAVYFERGDMKQAAADFSEEAFWLFGQAGLDKFNALPFDGTRQTVSQGFQYSGYYIMRSGGNYTCIDCGELADGLFRDETPSVAHGHSDTLAFDLCAGGRWFIGDPGFNTYNGPLEWHRYYRSGRGHNTIEVDGHGQGRHEGRMGWSRVSLPKLHQWVHNDVFDYFDGEVDRLAHPTANISHRRKIFALHSGLWFMIDHVHASDDARHELLSALHFAPGNVEVGASQIRCRQYDDVGLNIEFDSAEPFHLVKQDRADETDPASGWVCRGYGYREPAVVAELVQKFTGSSRVVTVMQAVAIHAPEQRSELTSGQQQIHYRAAGRDYYLVENTGAELALSEPLDIRTNAAVMLVEMSDTGWEQICLVEAGWLEFDGKRIYGQERNAPYVVIRNREGVPEVTYQIEGA
jgi:hypothetical protein